MTGRLPSSTSPDSRRRALVFGAGFGILLAGTVLVAAGLGDTIRQTATAAGLPAGTAAKLGLAVAAGLLATVPAIVGATFQSGVGRWPRRIGAALVAVAILGGWTTVPAQPPLTTVPTSILAAYTAGLLLVFTGGLASGLAPYLDAPSRDSSTASISYQRRDTQRRITPADGGDEDDEITSPLDEDE